MSGIANVLNGFRLFAGEKLNEIIAQVNNLTGNGTPGAVTASTLTLGVQIATASGSNSQSGATAVTKSVVIATLVSATTRALRLPAAATGLVVEVFNHGASALKMYPATGDSILAAATNAVGASTVAVNKAIRYVAQNGSNWRTLVGA